MVADKWGHLLRVVQLAREVSRVYQNGRALAFTPKDYFIRKRKQ